jgi:sensor histidine kinase YesM
MTHRDRWVNALSWTVIGTITVTFIFTPLTWRSSWQEILLQSLANTIFAVSCVALCLAVIPRVAPMARRRLRFPFDWVAITLALVVMGAAGSVLATALGVVLGFIPRTRFFSAWYPNAFKISIYFTLLFGLTGTVIQELRGRLASTTVALRTKERDEADARRLAAEAQLASLEARVDPHFLFNTLNSIASLIRVNPERARTMVVRLARIMRRRLRTQDHFSPLRDELDFIGDYLAIELERFGDKLRVVREIDPSCADVPVPSMLLQPLVENSIKHGIANRIDGGTIILRARRAGGRLSIEVEDDGVGMPESAPEESRGGAGIGVSNVRERLQVLYGLNYTMTIESQPGRGTRVSINIPDEIAAIR